MSEMVLYVAFDQDMMHPKPLKVGGAGIDESMDGTSLTGFPRFTHCPNMQNEMIFKSKDSCVSQKTPHL
jgi:hypothetical protein